jgi:hypothetical protein
VAVIVIFPSFGLGVRLMYVHVPISTFADVGLIVTPTAVQNTADKSSKKTDRPTTDFIQL